MTAKERYRKLCETEGDHIPLFLQYWWMETVCTGKKWDVILAEDSFGNIIGAMPYLIGSKLGMRYIIQPQLTQYNGPWLKYPEKVNECKRLYFEKKVFNSFIEQLKELKLIYFQQNFSPLITNWLPFYWKGYRQTTRYTYRIEDIQDTLKVWNGFDHHSRQKKIAKAAESLQTDHCLTPEEFADFHIAYWKSRGSKDLVPRDLIIRLINTATQRNQGLLLGLRTRDGILQGARFVAYDSNCGYALLSALNPDGHDNGCSPLLFWEIIQRLAARTKSFDFEGSMDENIEQSYRLYGAVQTPYMKIWKWL